MALLIAYLLGIWTAMKSKNKNRDDINQAAKQGNEQPSVNGPISVMCLPPTLTDQERAEQKKKKRRETIKFSVEIMTLVFFTIYTGATILIWCVTKNAAETSKTALTVEHRPWIGPEHGPSVTLKVSSDEIEPSTFLSVRNYGSSVALNMAYQMEAAPSFDPPDYHVVISQMCQTAELAAMTQEHSQDQTLGVTIFPGGVARIKNASFAFNRWPLKTTSLERDIVVVGCLAYIDQFHSPPINSPIHHTRFCFENWQPISDVITAQQHGQPTATFLNCLFENNAD